MVFVNRDEGNMQVCIAVLRFITGEVFMLGTEGESMYSRWSGQPLPSLTLHPREALHGDLCTLAEGRSRSALRQCPGWQLDRV